jgi:hypothetical protein
MPARFPQNPEPVPAASQLAVMPFLAAIDGFLSRDHKVQGMRMTIHRAVNREGQIYLQQICGYVGGDGLDWQGKVGRTFPVSEGIMGAAFKTRRIWRTKNLPSEAKVRELLAADIKDTKDGRDPATVELSFLAIPFLGPDEEPVLILYAGCGELNFFGDDQRVANVAAMGRGFCQMFDWLQNATPFLNLRNFPLQKGRPVEGEPTVYRSVQEAVEDIPPPKFTSVRSFNYEAAAA